jgi:hypothetical protein
VAFSSQAVSRVSYIKQKEEETLLSTFLLPRQHKATSKRRFDQEKQHQVANKVLLFFRIKQKCVSLRYARALLERSHFLNCNGM